MWKKNGKKQFKMILIFESQESWFLKYLGKDILYNDEDMGFTVRQARLVSLAM